MPPGELMYMEISFFGLRLQKEQLRRDQRGDLVFDRARDKDDALLQQARIDVIGPLAAVGLLDLIVGCAAPAFAAKGFWIVRGADKSASSSRLSQWRQKRLSPESARTSRDSRGSRSRSGGSLQIVVTDIEKGVGKQSRRPSISTELAASQFGAKHFSSERYQLLRVVRT
jgi:hypothetical protein